MTRILVPLDGSALAERAVPCAAMLARGLRAELFLLQAGSLPSEIGARLGRSDPRAGVALEKLEAQAGEYLGRVAQRLVEAERQEDGLRVCVQQVVRQGPAAEAIVDHAAQVEAQLIQRAAELHDPSLIPDAQERRSLRHIHSPFP